jgi:hypothetical protein
MACRASKHDGSFVYMRQLLFSSLLALPLLCSANAFAAPVEAPRTSSIAFSGAMPALKDVAINSRNVYDYTFTTAPVDWKIQSGVWEMTNRWSCSPGWSWFGGRSDEVATIWNKRRLGGDLSAQMYFSFKMGLSGAWPEYPSDAAMTICGDGKSLGTGYSFIAGADDNTRSILMRNGVIVAESKEGEAILPRLTDGNPGNDAMHRRWWYLKMERTGITVKCYIDDKLIVSYDDKNPIEGGQTAIWTVNNGLMLARVQLYFQKELQRSAPKKLTPPSVQIAATPKVKL